MAFGVAILGSVQAVATAHDPGRSGYLTELRITLLLAAILLALAATAATSLYRRRSGRPDSGRRPALRP
jgi:Tfp pilus assembly protein FimT